MTFVPKPLYTIHELSLLFSKSTKSTKLILTRLNIPISKIGNKCYVYLSDLKDNAPDLYASLIETFEFQSIPCVSSDDFSSTI